jgi:hypothetical protein
MSARRPFARPLAALALALAAVFATPAAARAQDAPAGAVVIRNATGTTVTLTNFSYTDSSGTVRTLTGSWELKPGFFGYLTVGKDKIVARKIEYDLVTADGRTNGWSCTCRALDKDGDFSSSFTPENIADHRKALGKAVPAGGVQPAAAAKGPTDEQIGRGVVKVLGAALFHEATKKDIRTAGDALAVEFARSARDELIKSATDDLFPQLTAAERRTVSQMVCLAFDGRLTGPNLKQAEAKAALSEYLRKQNPDIALAAEVADFLYRVQQSANGR